MANPPVDRPPEADPPVNRITDTCKNITLPQTSFAGGNKSLIADVLNLSELAHILHLCCFSNMLCLVDALDGCDEDVQNTLLQNIGSQSMDNVHGTWNCEKNLVTY